MAIDKSKFRHQWLSGLREHYSIPAIGDRLKSKHAPPEGHEPSQGTPAPPTGETPMHGEMHESGADEMGEPSGEQASEADAGTEMGGETCPHCGSPMKPKAKEHRGGRSDHGLAAEDVALLLRAHG